MFNLRPKMFEESAKSHASPNLAVQLLIFLIVFFIIYVLEAIIPSIVSIPLMMEELVNQGYLEGTKKLTLDESMKIASELSGLPKIMIPTLLSTVFGTLISILYCRCFEMRPLSSMGMRKRRLIPHYLQGLAVGIAMMTAITLLTVVTGVNSISLCAEINYKLIALYFAGFLVQGMSEEFVFRGYLMNTVGGHHSAALAIGISAAAFGIAHAVNPGFGVVPMINLVLFGVFASLYMICFDDIWGVCAIHSVWNFTQGNIYGISVSGSGDAESVFRVASKSSADILTGGEFGIEGSLFTTLVLAVGIVIVLVKIKKNSAVSQSGGEE